MTTPGRKSLAEIAGPPECASYVHTIGGFVNLDNAATTPAFLDVKKAVDAAVLWYGSVHRGTGYTSRVSTQLLERARDRIFSFAGGRQDLDTIVFAQNSTSCINVLARRCAQRFGCGFEIIGSDAEHTSNLLPWMRWGTVRRCRLLESGDWDIVHLEQLLEQSRHPDIIAITAASNLTGHLTNVDEVARIVHRYNIPIAVDASQFVAHRSLQESRIGDEELWDFVVFAGHKMYAPYGTGVLVGPKDWFAAGWPDNPGGGTVRLIDGEDIAWADLPYREEGGTPNYVGIIAVATACDVLDTIGFWKIQEHEEALTETAAKTIGALDGITVHRPMSDCGPRWLPVFPFSVRGYDHAQVATYLGLERGIAVRSGHVCQHEFVRRLLGIVDTERKLMMRMAKHGDLPGNFGVVRASCGLTTTCQDIEVIAGALRDLVTSSVARNSRGRTVEYVTSGSVSSMIPDSLAQVLPWANRRNIATEK